MKNEHVITVRDLIEAYSGYIIFIRSESGHKMYFGPSYTADKRLQLCAVSEFCFSQIEGYFTLFITIKEVKAE